MSGGRLCAVIRTEPCHADDCEAKVKADGWACGDCLRWRGMPNRRLSFGSEAKPAVEYAPNRWWPPLSAEADR